LPTRSHGNDLLLSPTAQLIEAHHCGFARTQRNPSLLSLMPFFLIPYVEFKASGCVRLLLSFQPFFSLILQKYDWPYFQHQQPAC
jgi:hypothetical protein